MRMKPLVVRGLEIGSGMPKTVVPIMAQGSDDAAGLVRDACKAGADMVEWRADYLADLSWTGVAACLGAVRDALGATPLLFTLRSVSQGGRSALELDDASALIERVVSAKQADMIDVELGCPHAMELVDAVHRAGSFAVVSEHDFECTPGHEEISNLLQRELDAGADVAKVAVMANVEGDELRLMAAVNQFASDNPDAVLVGISMGDLGAITRIAGEFFGSSLTFCSAGEASAPGQLSVATARAVIAQLHEQGYNPSSTE